MIGNDYQAEAARTLIEKPDHAFSDRDLMLMWCALGLAGEAGETVDALKKAICHQHGLDVALLRKELGDVLWYVAGLCTLLEVDLSDVMAENIAKLRARYPEGYSSARSRTRTEGLPDAP